MSEVSTTLHSEQVSDSDRNEWLNIDYSSFALPHLDKASGYFLIMSSLAAHYRVPFGSAYNISKLAVGRLNEYIASGKSLSSILCSTLTIFLPLEHPQVKAIAVHPGVIATDMGNLNPDKFSFDDTVQLPAAALLQYSSGKYDWLSGQCVLHFPLAESF